ncbi:RNA 3'-phosphate cyclase [candidate division WOR-3 bacterium]|uniref:RNA 3'-terminal phosphate cyclase n=1 Tax=candidate division WOR-3 bacterium TaxID=2052148 RepID=A0A660SL42_UNCW3|nr:MAG: RNA 3'-phosphate cyclase [candidate division WOR-3 bacterium]
MLEIDGSYGEGGGQILRYSLALAGLTRTPFRIFNIRKGRKKPGLMPQHLASVRAVKEITRGEVAGDEHGSLELVFRPGPVQAGEYSFDVAEERGSAGSVALVLQAVLPILASIPEKSRVIIKGGTHVPFAPIYDYLDSVLFPFLIQLGLDLRCQIKSYGFYPKGGGEIEVLIRGGRTRPVELIERGGRVRLKATSVVANLPESIALRQLNPLRERLSPLETEVKVVRSKGPGTYIFLKAEYERTIAGFSALGRKGKPAEVVGKECLDQFLNFEKQSGIDHHLSDQILIYLINSDGKSIFKTSQVTNHLKTGIWIINRFLPDRVRIKGSVVEVMGRY